MKKNNIRPVLKVVAASHSHMGYNRLGNIMCTLRRCQEVHS